MSRSADFRPARPLPVPPLTRPPANPPVDTRELMRRIIALEGVVGR